MVAHLLAFGLPIAVCTLAVLNFDLFAFHPICMIIAVRSVLNTIILIHFAFVPYFFSLSDDGKLLYCTR